MKNAPVYEFWPVDHRHFSVCGEFPISIGLFDGELDFITGVQLGFMIGRHDPQLEDTFSGFDAVESALFAFEHPDELAVDICVRVMAALAFDEFEMHRHLIAFEDLAFGGGNDFDACALSWLGRESD